MKRFFKRKSESTAFKEKLLNTTSYQSLSDDIDEKEEQTPSEIQLAIAKVVEISKNSAFIQHLKMNKELASVRSQFLHSEPGPALKLRLAATSEEIRKNYIELHHALHYLQENESAKANKEAIKILKSFKSDMSFIDLAANLSEKINSPQIKPSTRSLK